MGELLRAGLANGACRAVSGRSLGENYGDIHSRDERVIKPFSAPLRANAGFAVMHGNLFDSAGHQHFAVPG